MGSILVTGGAGFLGSRLCDFLVENGDDVWCLDSFYSGKKENIVHLIGKKNFHLIVGDVRKIFPNFVSRIDQIYHLACPASPVQYQFDPVLTLETSVVGTRNVLDFARKKSARVLFTSTSEVYGDPLEHPQKESYFGNVDPLGKRSCYDEGKRSAESLCKDFSEQYGVDVRIVRLFNVYGPRMMLNDGRVLSNFIVQALLNKPLTVFGDGKQTRSFCFVDDIVRALMLVMNKKDLNYFPFNLGNPDERTINDLAELVKQATRSTSQIIKTPLEHVPGRVGDPQRRCPDISRAKELLSWQPKTLFMEGLSKTIEDFKNRLANKPHVAVFVPEYGQHLGPAENAMREIMARLPEWNFDVFTSRLSLKDNANDKEGDISVYRLGRGWKIDKYFFPLRAALFGLRRSKIYKYQFSWAVMASYGALAASFFSIIRKGKTPFVVSVFESKEIGRLIKKNWLRKILYKFIFKSAHRWQLLGSLSEVEKAWLKEQIRFQVVEDPNNYELLAKRTNEMFGELEILSTRL